MKLSELLQDEQLPDVTLNHLYEHHAEVAPGGGFIALSSSDTAWRSQVNEAIERGALAVLHDRADTLQQWPVPMLRVNDVSKRRGALAASFYQQPAQDKACLGITGTNGKTSTAYHLADLSERLGCPCGYSGTLGVGRMGQLMGGGLTTANAVALQRQLAGMSDVSRVAFEVSSHALDQQRAREIPFRYAAFTNLSRDHLDYHGSLAAYGAAKTRLFTDWSLQGAVINVDDDFGRGLLQQCRAERVLTVGEHGDVSYRTCRREAQTVVHWQTPWGEIHSALPLVADIAVANVTIALALLLLLEHTTADLEAALPSLSQVPGRLQVLPSRAEQPTVMVDFAHTPDALEKVLASLRPHCRGQLICVVGCGGDRDTGKRPIMGAVAAHGADLVWLTSDNPRSEDPAEIIAQMRAGVTTGVAWECVDRAQAIARAIAEAGAEDMVLIAGKGHEDYQEVQGQRLAFDDRLVAQHILEGQA